MDKIVFYVWVSYNNIYDDKIFDIALSENQAYIYRAFTHPDYRGLHIYPAGLSYVCKQLQMNNIKKCYIAASIENRSSINGIHRAGFSKIGYAVYFKVLNYKKIILPRMLQRLATTWLKYKSTPNPWTPWLWINAKQSNYIYASDRTDY